MACFLVAFCCWAEDSAISWASGESFLSGWRSFPVLRSWLAYLSQRVADSSARIPGIRGCSCCSIGAVDPGGDVRRGPGEELGAWDLRRDRWNVCIRGCVGERTIDRRTGVALDLLRGSSRAAGDICRGGIPITFGARPRERL